MKYQRTTFATIKQLLPTDAWAAWRNELHKGGFEAESLLVLEGPATLDDLNLDAPFEEELVFLILARVDSCQENSPHALSRSE